jgi:hypothetical protein
MVSGFNWYRIIAITGVIGIPIFLGLFEGINQLLIFLRTYCVLVAGIYLIAKANKWLKKH